ncbi:TonB-dependent receptor [Sphingopyxis indica]|uniref:TonB-dependent receptor domain-containing protein n=1 Tax=Sphingopyxis indica TaxID=436663 RepID=UPI002938D7FD|nr:TonB-dependent receptor [Sphingopyxis indica]WOF44543.1 TonB-dependent receptor [Sphingopyxis indica]
MTSSTIHILSALITGTAIYAVPAAAAQQPESAYDIDIREQDLGDALRSVAARAGWELYAAADDVNGRPAPSLEGRFTARNAIEALLAGSGLRAEFRDSAVIIKRRTAVTDASESEGAIVVTGTRIAGAPPAAPVTVVTNEDIRNGGQSDLGEVARSVPQNFGGGQNPGIGNGQGAAAENANVNGASTFNLRGIGPNATLTLLNGNRFAYTGISSVIDVSSIPVAAVDRIEIVADGASAIYGADAVAGVVNIRLKRDYHGLEAKARVGASTDGGNVQQQYGLLGGRSWTSGGVLAAYDYSHSSAIDAGERSYAGSMNPGSTLFPKTSRHSLLVSGHQAIGPDITLAADLLYKKGRVHQTLGYDQMLAPDVFGLDNVSTSESVGIAPSLSADLGRNWQFKASGFFGTDQTGGYAELFSGGDLLSHIDKHFFNRNLAIEGGFQGPLFRLAAGEVAVAFGAGARRNDFRAILPVNVVDRRRDNIFAYAEVFAPLTSPEQDIAGFHRLSVSGALRFEDYSDVRSIVTPKLGMTWEPVSSLRLAVSWGRSFKMPTLYQQYGGYSTVLARASSYGAGYPPMANVIVATGPDSRIGPERSENWTLSAQLTPVDGFKLTAAWYRIDYRDRVAPPISSFVGILDNPLYAGLVAQNPAAAELATLIEGSLFGLENRTGETYDPANVIALIDGRERNIARQRYSGIDLSARYRVALGPSERLTLSAAGSFLESRQQLISGLPWTDLAGTIFHPAKFRARGGLSYEAHHFTLSGFLNHMSALEDDRRDPTARIPPYTTLDVTARIKVSSKTELSIAALNVFDAKPTAIATARSTDTPFDTTNYSPAGRFLGLTVRQEW